MDVDRRISLHKLEVFVLVADVGGFGKAAGQLFVTQPVVTGHVRSLEERLGVRLFVRDPRGVQLTEAGHAAYRWAQDVLTRTRDLERHLADLTAGTRGLVAFGASMSLGSYRLPAVLTRYRRDNRNVDLRMVVASTDNILDDVRQGELDFGVVTADGPLAVSDAAAERLGEDEMVLVTAPESPPFNHTITLENVSRLPFIEAPGDIERRSALDLRLGEIGARRTVVLELGHPEARKRAARDGLGVTMQFRSAVSEDLERGTLREVRVAGVRMSLPVYLVRRPRATFSPLQAALIATIREEFAEHAPLDGRLPESAA
jgi:LysR family transcriptional regulator, low CO2-responsive transcriptional regulator